MSQEKAAEIIDFAAPRGDRSVIGDHETAGAFLAAARADAGISLAAISGVIKVKIEHLEAIEATRPDLLPAAPYAAGFVKVYARALGLDAEAVARQFREDIGAAAPAQLVFADAEPAARDRPGVMEGARLASIFGVIAVVLFVVWITAQILGGGAERDAPVAEEEPAARISDIPPFTPRATSAPVAAPAEPAVAQPAAPGPETGPMPRLKPAIVAASLTSSVAPGYPEGCAAGAAPLETVTVMFDITAAGRADNAQVVASSNACFEGEALRAIALWRFAPRTVGGVPAAAAGKRATLNFRG